MAVRNALPSEAPQIHRLLVEAFCDDILPFTIYRAPQSVTRVAELACAGRIRMVGDAEGIAISLEDHLDYLAVARSTRGKGYGRMLMDDFHGGSAVATRDGHSLDVLADSSAMLWYASMGYREEKRALSVRLALKNTGEPPETWNVALMEERIKGFSAVGHSGMRIGLLDGVALRMLDWGGRSVEEALRILQTINFAGRRELVLTGLEDSPDGFSVLQRTTSVRMRRKG